MTAIETRGLLEAKSCWFVPWSELSDLDNVAKPSYGYLRKVDSELSESDLFVREGEPFSITLESHFVKTAHDGDSENDLLVRSSVRYGDEPKVETLHFFRPDVESGTFLENFEHEHIFARKEFVKESRVWLSLEILEIDRGLSRDKDLSVELAKMHGKFGAIFPALIPFAPVAGAATRLLQIFNKAQEAAAENQIILSNQIDLYDKDLSGGDAPLRCGAYVLFKEDVQAVKYRLGSGFKLRPKALRDKNKPIQDDYAVIQIAPGFISSGKNSKDLLKNQQIAAVVSELDTQNVQDEKRAAHFEFIENLIDEAAHFKDILYLKEMRNKEEVGIALTLTQKEKIADIKTRLGHLL